MEADLSQINILLSSTAEHDMPNMLLRQLQQLFPYLVMCIKLLSQSVPYMRTS